MNIKFSISFFFFVFKEYNQVGVIQIMAVRLILNLNLVTITCFIIYLFYKSLKNKIDLRNKSSKFNPSSPRN